MFQIYKEKRLKVDFFLTYVINNDVVNYDTANEQCSTAFAFPPAAVMGPEVAFRD